MKRTPGIIAGKPKFTLNYLCSPGLAQFQLVGKLLALPFAQTEEKVSAERGERKRQAFLPKPTGVETRFHALNALGVARSSLIGAGIIDITVIRRVQIGIIVKFNIADLVFHLERFSRFQAVFAREKRNFAPVVRHLVQIPPAVLPGRLRHPIVGIVVDRLLGRRIRRDDKPGANLKALFADGRAAGGKNVNPADIAARRKTFRIFAAGDSLRLHRWERRDNVVDKDKTIVRLEWGVTLNIFTI
ncbi:MAG: hypothetical protein IKZ22_09445 [Kiritimatiellae bacterium]|nr:hypothetical protein [Kiritimatiellia bacterium]